MANQKYINIEGIVEGGSPDACDLCDSCATPTCSYCISNTIFECLPTRARDLVMCCYKHVWGIAKLDFPRWVAIELLRELDAIDEPTTYGNDALEALVNLAIMVGRLTCPTCDAPGECRTLLNLATDSYRLAISCCEHTMCSESYSLLDFSY